MLSKKLVAPIAAALLIGMSGSAVAQTAQPLSLSNSPTIGRSGASTQGESNLDRRGYGIYVIGAIVLAAIIYGIVKLANHNNNNPHSP